MVIIAKAPKGREYMYKISSMIKCRGRAQAEMVARYLTENNESVNTNDFRLGENEVWHIYTIDSYDHQPIYTTRTIKGNLVITRII